MATKSDVYRLHQENPNWSSMEIAENLGCSDGYVRATASRGGYKLPRSHRFGGRPRGDGKALNTPPPDSILRLGKAARAAGLTVDAIDFLHSSGALAELLIMFRTEGALK